MVFFYFVLAFVTVSAVIELWTFFFLSLALKKRTPRLGKMKIFTARWLLCLCVGANDDRKLGTGFRWMR